MRHLGMNQEQQRAYWDTHSSTLNVAEWSPLQLAYHLYIADELALEELKRVQLEEIPLRS